jgi:O-antigen/teichoic acid export membrane protein
MLQINGLWGNLNRAWTPQVFSNYEENRRRVTQGIEAFAFLSAFIYLIILTAVLLLGELFLFRLFLKEVYIVNLHLFCIVLLVPIFTGIYTSVYPLFYLENRNFRILLVSVALAVTSFFLTLILVKYLRENGAALVAFVMSAVTTMLYLFVFRKVVEIPRSVTKLTLVLFLLLSFGVVILIGTGSHFAFEAVLISASLVVYRLGRLGDKKAYFFNLARGYGRH